MGLRFEATTLDDRDEVERLLGAGYPHFLKAIYPADVLDRAMPFVTGAQDALLTSGTYFLVRNDAGRAVAAGGWTFAAPGGGAATPGLAHLRHVVTDPARAREGNGRALIRYLAASARAAGAERLEALSTRNAVPFYKACGFETRERIDVELMPGVVLPSVRMLCSAEVCAMLAAGAPG